MAERKDLLPGQFGCRGTAEALRHTTYGPKHIRTAVETLLELSLSHPLRAIELPDLILLAKECGYSLEEIGIPPGPLVLCHNKELGLTVTLGETPQSEPHPSPEYHI